MNLHPRLDKAGQLVCRECNGVGRPQEWDGGVCIRLAPCEACKGEGSTELPRCLNCDKPVTLADLGTSEPDFCGPCRDGLER